MEHNIVKKSKIDLYIQWKGSEPKTEKEKKVYKKLTINYIEMMIKQLKTCQRCQSKFNGQFFNIENKSGQVLKVCWQCNQSQMAALINEFRIEMREKNGKK